MSETRAVFAELDRWGPHALSGTAPSLRASRAYCRKLARTHYENFTVASWLLPRHLQRHFYHVYAFCRWADDLADEVGDPQRALELLAWWRDELERCYQGRPRHPVMVALEETIRRFDIPRGPFCDLLVAFEQDQRVREYETFEQLLEYCRYSANPVGRLVLRLGGCYDEERAWLADRICTALQLANFWQDVDRDLDRGRVYLPREDRQRFGYHDLDLQQRVYSGAFRELMRFQVARTRLWFTAGLPLADRVPAAMRVDVELFARGGLAVLDKIEAIDYDVWARRPTLSRGDQLRLLARCAARAALSGPFASSPSRRPRLRARFDGRSVAQAGRKGERVAPGIESQAAAQQSNGAAPTVVLGHRRRFNLADSYALCARLARRHARNFYPAFLLLPPAQRRAMCALYAFLRVADDIGDGPGDVRQRRQRLAEWRAKLDRALRGRYDDPILHALHHAIRRFAIPPQYVYAVLDGVEMDLDGTRYETFDDLYAYCYRVASAVGLACIHIWGFQGTDAEKHAEQCGIAFQLTNILRDVSEDARRGRIYLPADELARFGCDAATLRAGRQGERFQALMRSQVQRTRDYYREGSRLVNFLEPAGRRVFRALLGTYRELLEEIDRQQYNVFNRRISLSPWKKLGVMVHAVRGPGPERRFEAGLL